MAERKRVLIRRAGETEAREYKRYRVGPDDIHWFEGEPCGDCHRVEGKLHMEGCDLERCPACGDQFFCCDCDVAEHELTLTGTAWGGRIRVVAQGFTEAEAEARAHAEFDRRERQNLDRYLRKQRELRDMLVARGDTVRAAYAQRNVDHAEAAAAR